MRARAALVGALGATALTTGAAAVAQAPAPTGNFGGGALVSPPKDQFGPGNAVVALRALPGRKLEIEATARGACGAGEIEADAKVDSGGSFGTSGTATTRPAAKERVRTTYRISGTFSTPNSVDGTLSARIERRAGGKTKHCRSGAVTFAVRRPDGVIGAPGAPSGARYFGTTTQRSAGPLRPIVMRVSSDGRVLSRALFGESVRCSDDKRSAGLEAPRTNAAIDSKGRVNDRERFTVRQGNAVVKVDDRFTAKLGATGATGTFSLSDRTTDKRTGKVIQTCRSGVIRWKAAP